MPRVETVVQGVFAEGSAVQRALEGLLRQGFAPSQIEVRSSTPLDSELPGLELRSRVPLLGIVGGIVGGVVAFLVAVLTAKAYPLVTGGMPIVAPPPVGIITYEGIALGAILATVGGVLFECRLPRFGVPQGPLDHHVAEGKILVSVRCGDDAALAAAREGFTGAVAVSPIE